jgi:glycosyltransferase involved in cell wall biosynthesis
VGYTFFEDNLIIAQFIEEARRRYDTVVTGSRWCEQYLRHYGLKEVTTIVQGVDSTIFHPLTCGKEYLRDQFVVFSGGKFELRKGQDLVIRAFKALQDRHRDILLVNAWHNRWSFSVDTMRESRYIRFQRRWGSLAANINRCLVDNGIDLERVLSLAPRSNLMMARIYRNTDVGLFPNRCEGGTNLVLMEYMACGKPAIASFVSGHKDVLSPQNSIRIEATQPLTIRGREGDSALWDEPDLEETIAHLEWAYQNRERLTPIGRRAAEDMGRFTWKKAAEEFHQILTRPN